MEGRGGVVVANDPDRDRACMLAHRVNTLRSPCALVVSDANTHTCVGLIHIPEGGCGCGW